MAITLDCSDKVVVVIGGTSGINRGIAECFAAQSAKVAVASRKQAKVDQIGLQSAHDGLRFRVSETHVIFKHPWRTIGGNHEPGIQKTGERITLFRHTRDGRQNHLFHDTLMDSRGNDRCR